jgi:hypothetical protein
MKRGFKKAQESSARWDESSPMLFYFSLKPRFAAKLKFRRPAIPAWAQRNQCSLQTSTVCEQTFHGAVKIWWQRWPFHANSLLSRHGAETFTFIYVLFWQFWQFLRTIDQRCHILICHAAMLNDLSSMCCQVNRPFGPRKNPLAKLPAETRPEAGCRNRSISKRNRNSFRLEIKGLQWLTMLHEISWIF